MELWLQNPIYPDHILPNLQLLFLFYFIFIESPVSFGLTGTRNQETEILSVFLFICIIQIHVF